MRDERTVGCWLSTDPSCAGTGQDSPHVLVNYVNVVPIALALLFYSVFRCLSSLHSVTEHIKVTVCGAHGLKQDKITNVHQHCVSLRISTTLKIIVFC